MADAYTLSVAQVPSRDHGIQASSSAGDASSPIGNPMATAEDANRSAINFHQTAQNGDMRSTSSAGGGQAVNNMQPDLGMHGSIALVGIDPSRDQRDRHAACPTT